LRPTPDLSRESGDAEKQPDGEQDVRDPSTAAGFPIARKAFPVRVLESRW